MASFGGYFSCGQNPENLSDWSPLRLDPAVGPILPFVRKVRELVRTETNAKVHEFLACFGIDPTVVYVASTITGDVKVEKIPVDQVYLHFEEMIRSIPNPQVAVIGYSYGGPLAMELVSRLSNRSKVIFLTTMDPISHKECTPNRMFKAVDDKETNSPCNRFPPDFALGKIDQIASRVDGNWWNYYQRRSTSLKSDRVQDSKNRIKNILKDYQDEQDWIMAHAHFIIDRDLAFEVARNLASVVSRN
jgi:hypothetical protein